MALVTNIKNENDVISFDLNNNLNQIKNSFANAIRRIIISNVHTYIIDEKSIIFYENTSMLDKEFLKQRLILIPVISNIENIDYNNIIISCNINNEEENIKSVYVSDFTCTDSNTNKIIENNKLFKYPKILFAKIKNSESIIFEAKLIKNNSDNGGAFFSPVSQCVYTFKIDEKKVKEVTNNFNKEELVNFKTQDIERVYEKNSIGEPNVYQFKIESIGFYDNLSIVLLGIDELIKKLDIIKNEFENLEISSKIVIVENNTNPDFYNFSINDENDTIGNLLSTYITYYKNVLYCGYLIEHPLKSNIILRIKLNSDNTLENVIKVIIENINYINSLLYTLKKELTV
jgi:DNA-directed RNA polymerase subunit L